MWSNGFQHRLDLAAPDGRAAALLISLPALAAAGAAWLYLPDLIPRLLGSLGLLLLGLALALREMAGLSRRRVVRAMQGQRWELSTAAGECLGGRLVHGWEITGAGRHGLIGLGWSTPAGYRYLLAFTAALPPAVLRRLRVHRRLAAGGENATSVTLRRGQQRVAAPITGRDRPQ